MDATGQIEPGGDPAAEAAERALREGLRRRDPTAWATFVGRIHRTLLRQAGRLLPSHADPQDVVQQAIYRAFSHAADYDPDRPPYPWLVAICAHECLRRRRQLGRSASPLWTRDGGGSRAQDPVEVSEARAAVQRALGRLRRRERAVVNLRFSFRLSTAEIASALGIGRRAVETALHRALVRLRNCPEVRELKEWLLMLEKGGPS